MHLRAVHKYSWANYQPLLSKVKTTYKCEVWHTKVFLNSRETTNSINLFINSPIFIRTFVTVIITTNRIQLQLVWSSQVYSSIFRTRLARTDKNFVSNKHFLLSQSANVMKILYSWTNKRIAWKVWQTVSDNKRAAIILIVCANQWEQGYDHRSAKSYKICCKT